MKIKLSKTFAANGKVDEFDVRQVKKALNRLGYYQPYEKVGITGIPDTGIFTALKAFQKDNGLTATGTAKPDDDTIQALNSQASKTPDGYYIWRTVEDERVRAGHAVHDHETRAWHNSPDPGEEFNCRCWAEPATLEQVEKKKKKKCFDDLPWEEDAKANLRDHEDDIEHPYIDTAFKITVGIGINIDSKTKFLNLLWKIGVNGPDAMKEEIEAAYTALTQQKNNPTNIKAIEKNGQKEEIFNVLANNQRIWTNLWLSQEVRNELFNATFDDFRDTLSAKKFSDFGCFPPDAKVALMDMIFNLGETKFSRGDWPNLFKAVNQREWVMAAEQSHRKIPNDETNRNQDTHDQFIKAAKLEEQSQR